MRKRLLPAALIAATLTLAGCAVSPQMLTLQPQVATGLVAVGQGQPVVVELVDGRQSPALGSLGGLYADASKVTVTAAELQRSVLPQVETAVRLLGFTPVARGNAGNRLVVTVENLDYRLPERGYATQADIVATLRAEASNSLRRYSGRYTSTLNRRFAMTPNQQGNEELVSSVLTDVLNRAFQDGEIGRTLAGQ